MPIIIDITSEAPGTEPVSIPKFAYPFQFTDSGANVVEQDSLDDVFACVQAIVACPVGSRNENPAFGVASPLFSQAPIDTTGLRRGIVRWEPRAALTVTETADPADASTRHIRINVSAAQADR